MQFITVYCVIERRFIKSQNTQRLIKKDNFTIQIKITSTITIDHNIKGNNIMINILHSMFGTRIIFNCFRNNNNNLIIIILDKNI